MIDYDTAMGAAEDLMESQDVLLQIFASTEGARALLVEVLDGGDDARGVEQSIQLLEMAARRLEKEVFPILQNTMTDLVSPCLGEAATFVSMPETTAN